MTEAERFANFQKNWIRKMRSDPLWGKVFNGRRTEDEPYKGFPSVKDYEPCLANLPPKQD